MKKPNAMYEVNSALGTAEIVMYIERSERNFDHSQCNSSKLLSII